MTTLAEIRARLAAQDTRTQHAASGDNSIYPHWNIGENETAVVRFLPDKDETNPFFWVERQMIKLPFNGVKGGDTKQVIVTVPCVEMWNETCPILTEVRGWFKDPALEDMGRKYWKKKSYVFQGFVRTDPIGEENVPENPIRRFVISPQIFTIIKSSLMDPDMEFLPTDYQNGLDLRISKTMKGGYADYSTSNWARRESPLTEEEANALQTHGLFELASFLPNKPSTVAVRAMKEMFEASVNGEQYDPERWGEFYRPFGVDAPNGNSSSNDLPFGAEDIKMAEKNFTAAAKVVEKPVEEPKKESGSKSAEDILAMIKARQSQ